MSNYLASSRPLRLVTRLRYHVVTRRRYWLSSANRVEEAGALVGVRRRASVHFKATLYATPLSLRPAVIL